MKRLLDLFPTKANFSRGLFLIIQSLWVFLYSNNLKQEELNWFISAGKTIPSYDRVCLSLKTFEVILEGKYEDYLEFIELQPKGSRLSWSQFLELQARASALFAGHVSLNAQQMREVMELGIILSEIGSTQLAQDKAWVYEVECQDPSDFSVNAITSHPEIFPSYAKLTLLQKELMETIITMARFDEITKLNGGISMFEGVKKSNILVKHPDFFDMSLFLHICNLAGSSGQENSHSSSILTIHALKNIVLLRKAFLRLIDTSPQEAYQYYVSTRARWLGFDPFSPLSRVLTRIGAMMNLYTLAEGRALREEFLKLEPAVLQIIVTTFEELERTTDTKESSKIATYLATIKDSAVDCVNEKEKLLLAIKKGFPFMAKVFAERKGGLNSLDFSETPSIPIEQKDRNDHNHIAKEDKSSIIEG